MLALQTHLRWNRFPPGPQPPRLPLASPARPGRCSPAWRRLPPRAGPGAKDRPAPWRRHGSAGPWPDFPPACGPATHRWKPLPPPHTCGRPAPCRRYSWRRPGPGRRRQRCGPARGRAPCGPSPSAFRPAAVRPPTARSSRQRRRRGSCPGTGRSPRSTRHLKPPHYHCPTKMLRCRSRPPGRRRPPAAARVRQRLPWRRDRHWQCRKLRGSRSWQTLKAAAGRQPRLRESRLPHHSPGPGPGPSRAQP